jgi:tetratricopeptide (TPR) repeat protein
LAAVTALAFANAWPDAVAFDDKYFVNNQQLPDWTEPSELFRGDVWRTAGAQSGLYRPVLLLSLSLDGKLFGDWLAGYHLSNILLHLIVTLLVYGFLRQLLLQAPQPVQRPDLYALLAALAFAVHPVHTEVVNSVFNRSDMLVSLGAVGGLWWLLHFLESRPARAWTGLGIAYLFALLCKENAVVIPGLAVVLILFLPAESWQRRIRRSVPVLGMLLPLGIYLYMRAHGLASGGENEGEGIERVSAMVGEIRIVGPAELLDLVGTWGIGLRLMVWPHPLRVNYPPPAVTVSAFLAALQLALIVTGFAQLRKGRSVLLTALAWFYLAVLPASRLISTGSAEPHLAERYLYLPSVSVSILLAFGLAWLGRRSGRPRAVLLTLLAVFLLMPVTWLRNHEWRSDIRLFETEYRRSGAVPATLRYLTGAHLRAGNFARGAEICDRHPDKVVRLHSLARHCGITYTHLQRLDDAEQTYLRAIAAEPNAKLSSELAVLYVGQGRPAQAAAVFQSAIEQETNPAIRSLLRGLMLAHLFPKDRERLVEAREVFEEAYRLDSKLKLARTWAERITRALEAAESGEGERPTPQNQAAPTPISRQ